MSDQLALWPSTSFVQPKFGYSLFGLLNGIIKQGFVFYSFNLAPLFRFFFLSELLLLFFRPASIGCYCSTGCGTSGVILMLIAIQEDMLQKRSVDLLNTFRQLFVCRADVLVISQFPCLHLVLCTTKSFTFTLLTPAVLLQNERQCVNVVRLVVQYAKDAGVMRAAHKQLFEKFCKEADDFTF